MWNDIPWYSNPAPVEVGIVYLNYLQGFLHRFEGFLAGFLNHQQLTIFRNKTCCLPWWSNMGPHEISLTGQVCDSFSSILCLGSSKALEDKIWHQFSGAKMLVSGLVIRSTIVHVVFSTKMGGILPMICVWILWMVSECCCSNSSGKIMMNYHDNGHASPSPCGRQIPLKRHTLVSYSIVSNHLPENTQKEKTTWEKTDQTTNFTKTLISESVSDLNLRKGWCALMIIMTAPVFLYSVPIIPTI